MRVERPPELADGGFWYVVPVETTPGAFGDQRRPAVPVGTSYTATYVAGDRVVIRCPTPVVGLDAVDVSAGVALVAEGVQSRPRGRVRGR